ncbi:MAG TPA: type II toxin-antitoxin system RelE/ParE family toxin [Bacteroidales bacterium]|nr:type II toxin-antitoxin system RelE/ParE family toxin [Bacteroidales bacterium]
MPKQLIWSPLAEQDFESILKYVSQNWGFVVTRNFIERIDRLTNHISIHPRLFPLVNTKRKVRKCVVTKHNTLFYREKDKRIEILRIFDTRQNPEILKFK